MTTYDLTLTDLGERTRDGHAVQRVETPAGTYLGLVIETPGGWLWSPGTPTDDEAELRETAEASAQDLVRWAVAEGHYRPER